MNDFLEQAVGAALRRRGLKLVVAESCTGGLLGHRITRVAGASDYFPGGVIAYANEAKMALLGVPPGLLAQFGAVSEETVLEMARGVRQAFIETAPLDRLVGLAVSGIAGPGGGTPDKPVGLTYIGLSCAQVEKTWQRVWPGDRSANQADTAEEALRLLLETLEQLPDERSADQRNIPHAP